MKGLISLNKKRKTECLRGQCFKLSISVIETLQFKIK